jgi:RNA chaperone Hfq
MTETAALYEVGTRKNEKEPDMQRLMLRKFMGSTVTTHLVNGFRMIGKLTAHDQYTIVIDGCQLIYKHAIATIQQGSPRPRKNSNEEDQRA